ncbi:AAA family ATPase [Streptomyces genisteinicus]|uniref:Helix-turn-helix transcriptional regulator n=1 Tax=Streptomyces genisteinicus TaxID=2768068 RepID=A0A7H0I1B6_9ACTN|nr:AAA family ATPase [Streptomyces genisteinicus]QNP66582.1 helix-turn-helix transcriptional regulator [Streptomyces genisteinicus]
MTRPLRERDRATALLAAETERARAGSGGLVLFQGATGTGRTAVLDSAVRHAADRGLRVLRARCSPEDTGVPFATVLQLLGPVPDFFDVTPGGDDRGSAARLWRLLLSYADEGPVLMAVDDVHLADAPSRRWLREAVRRVDRLPVLLVAGERSQYDIDPGPAGLAQSLPPSLVRTHTLAPLGETAAAALVRAAFPAAGPRRTAECVRAGAGNPMLLHALLDDLGSHPRTDGSAPQDLPELPDTCAALYPGGYPAAVSWWLKSAGRATAEVARCLAALEEAWPDDPSDPGRNRPGLPVGTRHTPDAAPGDVRHALSRGAAAGEEWHPWSDAAAGAGRAPSREAAVHHGAPQPSPAHSVPSQRSPSHAVPGHAVPGHAGDNPPASAYAPAADTASAPAPAHPPVPAPDGRRRAQGTLCTDEGTAGPHHPGSRDARPPGRTPDTRDDPADTSGTSGADPVELIAVAAGADPARVTGWLTAMTRIGMLRRDSLGRPRFAHPLLRDAVLTGWPTSRREAAHRAAAETMLERGERVEAVARHLLRTPPVGLPWALRVLRDAATVAVHAARPEDAAGYLRRSLGEPLAGDLRQRLLTELGSLEYASAGPAAAIARLAEAQHLPAEPRDRVRAAVALGTALAGRGEIRTALEVLRRTEGRLGGHPGLTRTVQTATALLSDLDLAARQETYGRMRETGGRSPERVGTAGQILLVRYAATAALISADEAMAQVRALLAQPADPLAEPFLLGTAAAVAQWADQLDEAERLVDRGLAGQHPALLHPMQHALLNTRADIAAARGDHAALLATVRGDSPAPARPREGPSNRDAHVLMALVHTGRAEEAERLANAFDLGRAPESWELNRFLYARGVQRAAAGDPAGAVHDFLECGRRQAAREVISPVVTPWRSAAAECRLSTGGGHEALALATEELRLAQTWNTPRTVGRALRVLGGATGGRRGLKLAGEAVDILREAPADTGTELIEALLAQGRQLLAAGERGRARDRLREAAELARRKGAVRLFTLAGHALREGGARGPAQARTGSGALTGSERRIAELAAGGRTNTEIADLLHLARRTVETHLTSTYRKLGIRRRTELPAALLRTGGPEHAGAEPGEPGA